MSPNVPAILGVLRHAAIAGRGVLLLSDVEALEELAAEHRALREALKQAVPHPLCCEEPEVAAHCEDSRCALIRAALTQAEGQ